MWSGKAAVSDSTAASLHRMHHEAALSCKYLFKGNLMMAR